MSLLFGDVMWIVATTLATMSSSYLQHKLLSEVDILLLRHNTAYLLDSQVRQQTQSSRSFEVSTNEADRIHQIGFGDSCGLFPSSATEGFIKLGLETTLLTAKSLTEPDRSSRTTA